MINILRELCRNKKGRIENVAMADIFQLIWLEKMTCQLLVRSDGKSGALNILNGELKNATIELDNNATPVSRTLAVSTEEMLLFRPGGQQSGVDNALALFAEQGLLAELA